MKRFRKYSLPVVAAAILAVILTLAAPRAVHAVTAALVNVTNTAASPAVAQSVSQLASQNVFLSTGSGLPAGFSNSFSRESPDGSLSGVFVVPAGQSLVITSIDVVTSASPGIYRVDIFNGVSGALRKSLRAQSSSLTQFQYPSGIVFPAGETVVFANSNTSPNFVVVEMHGYLTSN